MTPRSCVNCGAQIAADAPAHKIFCSKVCTEATYPRRQRDRRPDRPAKPAKRPPAPRGVNLDAVGARLRRREQNILDDWRDRLTSAGRLPVHRDGTRLLFDRDELASWVRSGGAKRP